MGEKDGYVAEGFRFLNEQDAKLAAKERKQVEFLQQRVKSEAPEEIRDFYDKAIKDMVFKTPVGLEYLKQLQNYMIHQGIALGDELMPIPINHPCANLVKPRKRREEEEKQREKERAVRTVSLILNGMLIAAIVVMFLVAKTSNHPNVLNYQKALTNQYASWEQELKEREDKVREKEKELKLWSE